MLFLGCLQNRISFRETLGGAVPSFGWCTSGPRRKRLAAWFIASANRSFPHDLRENKTPCTQWRKAFKQMIVSDFNSSNKSFLIRLSWCEFDTLANQLNDVSCRPFQIPHYLLGGHVYRLTTSDIWAFYVFCSSGNIFNESVERSFFVLESEIVSPIRDN